MFDRDSEDGEPRCGQPKKTRDVTDHARKPVQVGWKHGRLELKVPQLVRVHSGKQARQRGIAYASSEYFIDLCGDQLGDRHEEHLCAKSANPSGGTKNPVAPMLVEHCNVERSANQRMESRVLLLLEDEESKCADEVVGDHAACAVE